MGGATHAAVQNRELCVRSTAEVFSCAAVSAVCRVQGSGWPARLAWSQPQLTTLSAALPLAWG